MKISELIEKLKEFPQNKELPIEKEVLHGENTDFNRGVLIGMCIVELIHLNSTQNHGMQEVLPSEKDRFANISGDYEKYIRGNICVFK